MKCVVQDFKDKGADPSLLLALARIRPYVQRLLAQEVVPLPPGEVTEPTPADAERRLGLLHGTTGYVQAYYAPAESEQLWSTLRATDDGFRDDSSVADSEMERFLDSLAC